MCFNLIELSTKSYPLDVPYRLLYSTLDKQICFESALVHLESTVLKEGTYCTQAMQGVKNEIDTDRLLKMNFKFSSRSAGLLP